MKKDIMRNFTECDHRKRLFNLKFINENTESCLHKQIITEYIPGQYIYPSKTFNTPENDEALLKMLSENGVGLIQIWEDQGIDENGNHYDNSHCLIDGTMYQPHGERAKQTRNFLKMAHKYGLKVIPYTATNFYTRKDKNFNPNWALEERLDLAHLAHCSASSPGWREVMIRQYAQILDAYEFDGVYIDCGYVRTCDSNPNVPYYMSKYKAAEDEVVAFEESKTYDGAMEDMLALIYGEVKSRGGILKLHKEGVDTIHAKEKLYDYLWVGEAVREIDYIREYVKNYNPYVIPDYNFALENDDERYLNTIPYMQFPVVRNGRMGIGASDAGYPDFDRQLKWLMLYKKMTTWGTWCYTDTKIPALVDKKDNKTVISIFANLDIYVVIANYKNNSVKAELKKKAIRVTPDGEDDTPVSGEITLNPREIAVFKVIDNLDDTTSYIKVNMQTDLLGI